MKIVRVRTDRPEAAFCGCTLCGAYMAAIKDAIANRERSRRNLRLVQGGKVEAE